MHGGEFLVGEGPRGEHRLAGSAERLVAKRPLMLKVRLPEYHHPRNAWRRAIRLAVRTGMKEKGIEYTSKDKLEIHLRLYFREPKLSMVDVDNRLKDVMDALQGQVGGGGKKRRNTKRVIPNDRQIYRVTVEKGPPPCQSHELGHLTIKRYKGPPYRT